MTNKGGAAELLEAIQARAALEYLSDLHEARFRPVIGRAVDELPIDAYDERAWYAAAAYILGERDDGRADPDGRRYLLERLL